MTNFVECEMHAGRRSVDKKPAEYLCTGAGPFLPMGGNCMCGGGGSGCGRSLSEATFRASGLESSLYRPHPMAHPQLLIRPCIDFSRWPASLIPDIVDPSSIVWTLTLKIAAKSRKNIKRASVAANIPLALGLLKMEL
ncbi:hypothetical protein MPTK1_2g15210 [Marchantia polymorpha subsp. ruderalis]|uniref:Uncharacterized protein n=1 Tax=Marchantia polymorpha TaxID=3197 RepID=A0A2R6WJY3_MARPO|nr:hypothetical protein MARPO_0082s0017 [Marchantia polymorpha]BBN02418.1 hypothetical protein Mp_2g15210 [Marchantia polymorpha subsp. ruderalis]|eukprot:PTQ34164.1 hypothetical protein MARPO_0082s0017 [Marchantia polymorpha]